MLKNFKKAVSFVLVLALSATVCVPSFAAVPSTRKESNVISFAKYDSAIRAEYAKYHVKYESTNYNKSFVFTQEALDQKLKDIDKTLSGFTYDTAINAFVNPVQTKETIDDSSCESSISPDSVFTDINHNIDVTATSPSDMGSAQIRITINTTEELQSSTFVTINSCTSRQYGLAVNFKSWTDKGNSLSINSDRTWVTGNVYGTLVVQYTEPKTGITATYSSDHAWNVGITP